jgi:hypothetical protein
VVSVVTWVVVSPASCVEVRPATVVVVSDENCGVLSAASWVPVSLPTAELVRPRS